MTEDTPREFTALVARLSVVPRAERPLVLSRLLPHLAQPAIPAPARIAAAARALKVLPDRDRPVRRIARALIAGLSRSQGLDRLRQLQHQIETCTSLDRFIEERERRLRLRCPRCQVRLPRVEMVKHLWHEHGLVLERGKARSAEWMIEVLRARFLETGAGEHLDHVAAMSGPDGLRRWLASGDSPIEELTPLLAEAREREAGLCPHCLSNLPVAIASLPKPLTYSRGRLAGEGFAVEVGGNAWYRTLRVTTAGKTAVGRRSLAPRAASTLAAALVLVGALLVARTLTGALVGLALAAVAYTIARALLSSSRDPSDRAIDAAWTRLGARLAERPNTARFLTRLCMASSERGEPELRAWILNAMTRRAGRQAAESDEELQLLAASRVLQVEDMRRLGRDVTAGIAALAADGFTGALSADYAEFVVGCYLAHPREPGELGRLRVLVLQAAFDAGLAPRDLTHLWSGAPFLRRAMLVEPTHRLGLLFGLWRHRDGEPWRSVGDAVTVYDLARSAPPTAARLLAQFPDVLLVHRTKGNLEALLGPILVCARGVSIGGVLTADPDAEVRLTNEGRRLVFGRHRLDVAMPLPGETPERLVSWLRFRAEVLMPFIEESASAGPEPVRQRILGPFCRRCLSCGTISAVSVGAIGQPIPLWP
jgi:uncharacterized C2H2 Zn-finger protein